MKTINTPSFFSINLKKYVGKCVVDIIRFSWWPKYDVSTKCGISNELAFSLTAGPLEIVFDDGSSLGIASDPGLNSVIVWNEKESKGRCCVEDPLDKDVELYSIKFSDDVYSKFSWRSFFNVKLIGFSIIKKISLNAIEKECPSELGLCLIFEGGVYFIASHGLHDGSDDFSVLMPDQFIVEEGDEFIRVPL